jgi:predicted lipoprotein with Yx(FWY)xxD motif
MKKTLVLLAIAAALVPAGGAAVTHDARSDPSAREAMTPKATLSVKTTRFGKILFAGNGRVLYGFTRDKRNGPSQCYGDCAAAWPVYFKTGALKAGAGVKQSLLGTVKRRSGKLQVTYNGWPLYYYAHEKAGEVKCQNVETHGGTWLVVRPAGTLVRGN